MPETLRLSADRAGLAEAGRLLAAGELVAFPTETVYGLGADARSDAAVAAIYAAKGRPQSNPLILHLPDIAAAARFGRIEDEAARLAEVFWPGPLTLVVPRRADAPVAAAATAGLDTVALRVPAHPVARGVLAAAGVPVAAPSANPSGRVSPTSAAHVLDGLAGRIAAVVDGGACPVGLESTILGVAPRGEVVLLRPGGIAAERIETTLGRPLALPAADHSDRPEAPGRLRSHYAPGARLRLAADRPREGEGWLGFGPVPPGVTGPALTLSARRDPREAAANLFAHLRALDAAMGGHGIIAVAPVPEEGLGRAINDRLARAAAPRG